VQVILLSGAIGVGKTTVASALAEVLEGEVVRVREALASVVGLNVTDRLALQTEGAELDRRTNGGWLVDYLERRLEFDSVLIVDSVRTLRQTLPVFARYPETFLVYLEATASTRRTRFDKVKQEDPVKKSMSWVDAMRHPTEIEVSRLKPLAQLEIETDSLDSEEVAREIISALRRLGSERGTGAG
jgi:cytidylate kinase